MDRGADDEPTVLGVLGTIGFLGPSALTVRSERKRRLLAGLALNGGQDVSSTRLCDIVWGATPPRTAHHALHVYVSELRAQLGHAGHGLATTSSGYRLDARHIITDVSEVEELAGAGRAASVAGRFETAADLLSRALGRWRGEPFEGIEDDEVVRIERARLEALRSGLSDELADAYLALGRHADLIPQLQARILETPLHERSYEQLMLALYRDGRQSDSLDVFQQARTALLDQIGVDPGRRLVDIQHAVLVHDPSLQRPDPVIDLVLEPHDFVGRTDELDHLSTVATDVAAHHTVRVVLVGGEPGIGKTRVVDEWTRRHEQWAVLRGRCPDDGGVPSLWPLGEALGSLDESDLAGARNNGVLAPLLRLLGVDVDDETPADRLSGPEPFVRSEAIADLVLASLRGPTVLVIDDAHWADEATLGAVTRLVQRVRSGPLHVILTHRIAAVDRCAAFDDALARLVREPGTTRLEIGPLTDQDVVDYLQSLDLDLSTAKVDAIRLRSEGSPLFLAELARMIAHPDGSDLPGSLRQVLDARLLLLGDQAAEVLACAAVVGRDFDSGILARIVDRPADQISSALAAGSHAGVIRRVADTRWSFTHGLLADAAADRLDDTRRRRTHLRIAEILDGRSFARSDVAVIERAQHRVDALPLGDPTAAATACLLAGDRSMSSFAYDDAAKWFASASTALDHGSVDDTLRVRALVSEGEALAAAGAGRRAVAVVESALELADPATDPEVFALAVRVLVLYRSAAAAVGDERLAQLLRLAIAGLADTPGWLDVQLRTDLAMLHYRTEDAALSETIAREAFARALDSGDPLARALASTGLHQAIWHPQTVDERIDLATTAIAQARAIGLTYHESMATSFRAADSWERGDFDRVARDLAVATDLATQARRPRFMWIARSWTALLDLYQGDTSTAETGFAEALSFWGAEPNPDALQCFFAQQLTMRILAGDTRDLIDGLREVAAADPDQLMWNALLSYPLVLAGEPADAERAIDHVMAVGVDRLRRDVTHHVALAMLVESAGALGRTDLAAAAVPILEPFSERRIVSNVYGGGGLCWGSVSHELGVCEKVLGNVDGSRERFEVALRHHRSDGSRPFAARTENELASLGT